MEKKPKYYTYFSIEFGKEFFLKYFEQEENSKWKAMNDRLHIPPQSTENFFTYPTELFLPNILELRRHLT